MGQDGLGAAQQHHKIGQGEQARHCDDTAEHQRREEAGGSKPGGSIGVLAGSHGQDRQEYLQTVADLHAALYAVNFLERLKVADTGPRVVGIRQGRDQLGDLTLHIAVCLAHLAVGRACAARLNGMMQAAHGAAAACQILCLLVAAQRLQRDDLFQIKALLVGVQLQRTGTQRNDAGALAPFFAELQQV